MDPAGQARVERRLAAILAADVAGYSRLIGADEGGTLERLRAAASRAPRSENRRVPRPPGQDHRRRVARRVRQCRGCIALCRRGAARDGRAQRRCAPDNRIEFRIGINVGDIVVEDGDIFGDGVNVAARLEGLAEPGGICVAARVQEDAAGKLDLAFEDIGEQQLKNIARPVRAYRVVAAAPPAMPQASPGPPLPDKPSIAVLPFANMSGDPEQEYFVDGMVEDITTAIARLPWLFVIARNSSFAYKGKSPDLRQVGRELGVRYVLEGSVRKAGNRVRITGQLIDTTSGAHIWADRIDGALDDIFELQDQVASKVVGAIEPRLRLSEIERATRKPTESLDAYDLYLRALAQSHKFTEESLREAVALAKNALAIDPSYMPAAALIGWCRMLQRVQIWGAVSDAEIAEAVRLARQAIEAGRDDPDVLSNAGYTIAALAGEPASAMAAVDRALALNPNSAQAWGARGWVLGFQNQLSPAIEAQQQAIRLSPLDPLAFLFSAGLGFAHLAAGRYEEAIEWADRTLHTQPRHLVAMRFKLVCLAHLGRTDDAREWLKHVLAVHPGLTIAAWKASYAAATVFSPELLALYTDGLRKAGVPEE